MFRSRSLFHRATIFKGCHHNNKIVIQEFPCQDLNKVQELFTLAPHFTKTFEKQTQPWRKTSHHLFLAQLNSICVGFTGIEIGEGAIIQEYIGQHQQNLWLENHKVCFVHAVEVAPNYRRRGIHDYFWRHLTRYSLDQHLDALVFEPINLSKYMHYFLKMGIEPQQHALSRIVNLGLRGNEQIRYGEEEMSIFHLKRDDIQVIYDFLAGGQKALFAHQLALKM